MKVCRIAVALLLVVGVQASQVSKAFGLMKDAGVASKKTMAMVEKLAAAAPNFSAVQALLDGAVGQLKDAHLDSAKSSDQKIHEEAIGCLTKYNTDSIAAKGGHDTWKAGYDAFILAESATWEFTENRCEFAGCAGLIYNPATSGSAQCSFRPKSYAGGEENFDDCSMDPAATTALTYRDWGIAGEPTKQRAGYNTCVTSKHADQLARYDAKYQDCKTKEEARDAGMTATATKCTEFKTALDGARTTLNGCTATLQGMREGDSDLLAHLKTSLGGSIDEIQRISCIFTQVSDAYTANNDAEYNLSAATAACPVGTDGADEICAGTTNLCDPISVITIEDTAEHQQRECGTTPSLTGAGHENTCERNDPDSTLENGAANSAQGCAVDANHSYTFTGGLTPGQISKSSAIPHSS